MRRDPVPRLPGALSFANIARAVANFRRSGATWLIATTFPEWQSNLDARMATGARLNFERAPFDWGAPGRAPERKLNRGRRRLARQEPRRVAAFRFVIRSLNPNLMSRDRALSMEVSPMKRTMLLISTACRGTRSAQEPTPRFYTNVLKQPRGDDALQADGQYCDERSWRRSERRNHLDAIQEVHAEPRLALQPYHARAHLSRSGQPGA